MLREMENNRKGEWHRVTDLTVQIYKGISGENKTSWVGYFVERRVKPLFLMKKPKYLLDSATRGLHGVLYLA